MAFHAQMTISDETRCNRYAIDFRSPILTEVAGAVLGIFMEPFSETLTGLRVPRNLLQGRGSNLQLLGIFKNEYALVSFLEIRGDIFVDPKLNKQRVDHVLFCTAPS